MNLYPIKIHGLNIAPAHKVFGKGEEDLSGHDLESKAEVNFIADSGIEGDRFCRPRPDYNGHVTFFSQEVWNEISTVLDLAPGIGPELTRRNIIISGIDLKALYGVPFTIQDIQFLGTVHCAPCLAMNKALGEGAREAMQGRGGLRAQVKSNGVLSCGSGELLTEVVLDPANAGSQPALPEIP